MSREAFEEWIKSKGCDVSKTDCNNPIYMSRDVQGCWLTWQAAQQETFVADVRKFAEAAGQTTDEFNVRQTALYIGLQLEEMAEKLEAIGIYNGLHDALVTNAHKFKDGWFDAEVGLANRDEMLDADIDLAWVTVGAALSSGADVLGAMKEVARSNFSKMVDGKMVKDSSGKVQKPETFSPPNLLPFIKNV